MTAHIEPDPSAIGGVPEAPFAFLPDPVSMFETRASRFAFLAGSGNLGPYLAFLADLSRAQARAAAALPALPPLPDARLRLCREAAMPPIERPGLARDPDLLRSFEAFCTEAESIEMPDAARSAFEAIRTAPPEDLVWAFECLLSDQIPEGAAAPFLFVAGAVQIHLSRRAATLDPAGLVPIGTGLCPSCGGKPVSSSVMAAQGIENVRYACCAGCATRWNEVRIKCLCCGSNAGLAYRSVETVEASVKAESCNDCGQWLKIFYLTQNPTLDPVADDVASLGLDLMMRETHFSRGGFHAFLAGY